MYVHGNNNNNKNHHNHNKHNLLCFKTPKAISSILLLVRNICIREKNRISHLLIRLYAYCISIAIYISSCSRSMHRCTHTNCGVCHSIASPFTCMNLQ